MEESFFPSGNSVAFFHVSVFLDYSYQRICFQKNTLHKSFAKFWSFLRSPLEIGNSRPRPESRTQEAKPDPRNGHDDESSVFLRTEEVEMVMGRLGLDCIDGGIRGIYGADEMSRVLEDLQEARSEEVEGAFRVFDENGDGFIDAEELQRVLSRLGFMEGKEIEDCEKMIGAFDRNGDGKIDFEGFVMLLEN